MPSKAKQCCTWSYAREVGCGRFVLFRVRSLKHSSSYSFEAVNVAEEKLVFGNRLGACLYPELTKRGPGLCDILVAKWAWMNKFLFMSVAMYTKLDLLGSSFDAMNEYLEHRRLIQRRGHLTKIARPYSHVRRWFQNLEIEVLV